MRPIDGDALINRIVFHTDLPQDVKESVEDEIENAPTIPITPKVLADALMEERIRGKLHSDTIFEKDVIRDVKCRLTVSIRDHRPCYCGAELREVWREVEPQGKEE